MLVSASRQRLLDRFASVGEINVAAVEDPQLRQQFVGHFEPHELVGVVGAAKSASTHASRGSVFAAPRRAQQRGASATRSRTRPAPVACARSSTATALPMTACRSPMPPDHAGQASSSELVDRCLIVEHRPMEHLDTGAARSPGRSDPAWPCRHRRTRRCLDDRTSPCPSFEPIPARCSNGCDRHQPPYESAPKSMSLSEVSRTRTARVATPPRPSRDRGRKPCPHRRAPPPSSRKGDTEQGKGNQARHGSHRLRAHVHRESNRRW